VRPAGTRRFASDTVTVTIDRALDDAILALVREVAGGVVDVLEDIASKTVGDTKSKWYTMVRKKTGKSGAGNKYRMEVRGDTIRAIVYNDAVKLAKRNLNVDAQGRLLPGKETKHERITATTESYAYFVHAPLPLSTIAKATPIDEYKKLMSLWRKERRLPPGYIARDYVDKKGRARPVGIARIVRNPLASDGKTLWSTLAVKGSKAVIKSELIELDRALQAAGKNFGRR
jgi:hypothetical protein